MKKVLCVYLNPTQHEALKELSQKLTANNPDERIAMSTLIREALDHLLSKEEYVCHLSKKTKSKLEKI